MEKNIKPIYSDIFPISETKGLFKLMALVRFNKCITEKRIIEYNLGKSHEEIYKAVASIEYKSGLVDPAHIPSDMQALAQIYDTNGNGQLDPGDARWSEFSVWQDLDQDGVSDAGELHTLTELGIIAIGLVPSGEVQHLVDGTIIRGTSTYSLADGTTRTAADVQLAFGHALDDTGTPRTVSLQSDLSHVSYVTSVLHDAASGSDIGQIDLSQTT